MPNRKTAVCKIRAMGISRSDAGTGDSEPFYRANALTVAWRSVLLPARCFTRTISLGSHHLASVSRVDLNAAQDVVRRSSTAKNCVCSSSLRAINAAPA